MTESNVVPLSPRPFKQLIPVSNLMSADEWKRAGDALKKWNRCGGAEETLADEYLMGRGVISELSPLPPSIRFISAQGVHCLVAAITCPVTDEVIAIHAIFLKRTRQGVEKIERKTYGPARFGSVRLSPPALKMQITESVEDGLALMQLNGQPTLAVPGTNFLAKHVIPPSPCGIVVLAPDNDEAGRAAIGKAILRLEGLGYVVRVLLPPAERDWCDVLPEYEERDAFKEEDNHG